MQGEQLGEAQPLGTHVVRQTDGRDDRDDARRSRDEQAARWVLEPAYGRRLVAAST